MHCYYINEFYSFIYLMCLSCLYNYVKFCNNCIIIFSCWLLNVLFQHNTPYFSLFLTFLLWILYTFVHVYLICYTRFRNTCNYLTYCLILINSIFIYKYDFHLYNVRKLWFGPHTDPIALFWPYIIWFKILMLVVESIQYKALGNDLLWQFIYLYVDQITSP